MRQARQGDAVRTECHHFSPSARPGSSHAYRVEVTAPHTSEALSRCSEPSGPRSAQLVPGPPSEASDKANHSAGGGTQLRSGQSRLVVPLA